MAAEYLSPGVYVEEIPAGERSIAGVFTCTAVCVDAFERGPSNRAVVVRSVAEFEATFGGARLWSPASLGIRLFFENGGKETWVVRVARGAGGRAGAASLIGKRSTQSGLYALDRAGYFGLLCLPAAAELRPASMRRVYSAAAGYCDERRALLLVDVGSTVDSARTMHNWIQENEALRHLNVAVYFPGLRMAHPMRRRSKVILAPSGAIAGLIARIDATRGVWKAPAGTGAQLRGVLGPAFRLTDADVQALDVHDVNCLRPVGKVGIAVWGARIFGKGGMSSEGKYISARRMALYIEESIYQGTQWVVFEPNGEMLWSRVRRAVEYFMLELFRQGALAGRTPQEAYFVKCDGGTTTQNDINNGTVNMEIGFAPLKPAEFVVIKIQQKSG
jgi:phage tail sheath protein FI